MNLKCELIVSGFMHYVTSPTNCGKQFAWAPAYIRRCKRFTNYNWARSAAVYTARPTFSLFDICI